MSLTLELPAPLDQEITQDAMREGVPPAEHATLLLYLAAALTHDEAPSPFQRAVKAFLAERSLDAGRLASVLDELIQLCLADVEHRGEAAAAFPRPGTGGDADGPDAHQAAQLLREWRNALVHHQALHPTRQSSEARPVPSGRRSPTADRPGNGGSDAPGKHPSAFGKYAGLIPSSDEYLREKQVEIAREDQPGG